MELTKIIYLFLQQHQVEVFLGKGSFYAWGYPSTLDEPLDSLNHSLHRISWPHFQRRGKLQKKDTRMRCNLLKTAPVEVKRVLYCLVEVWHHVELKNTSWKRLTKSTIEARWACDKRLWRNAASSHHPFRSWGEESSRHHTDTARRDSR